MHCHFHVDCIAFTPAMMALTLWLLFWHGIGLGLTVALCGKWVAGLFMRLRD